ncbi:hypothetical protein [Albirhodobacter sp. R86504]|uniref:hypothetical protein n=1 Tax=Albirhodobacter sp. R86504 TaxID=3093848 RepID=UPI003670960A
MLYNDQDGPIIHLGPGRQGKSEANDILGNLEAAEPTILRVVQDSKSSLPPQVVDWVEQLLKALPFPQSLLFEDGWSEVTPSENALTLIVGVREFLARQIEVQARGNARDFRAALSWPTVMSIIPINP